MDPSLVSRDLSDLQFTVRQLGGAEEALFTLLFIRLVRTHDESRPNTHFSGVLHIG